MLCGIVEWKGCVIVIEEVERVVDGGVLLSSNLGEEILGAQCSIKRV